MDDIFGQKPKSPREEAWHQQQRQQTYDIVRIKNPTNKDFYIRYDTNQYQKVPANSTLDVPRYKARWYIKHMKDEIINTMIQEKHDAEIADRKKKGFPDYKSKWEENQETYVSESYPKTDDPKLMRDIISELWVGLVLENKSDAPPTGAPTTQIDLSSSESKILESFENRRITDEVRTVVSPAVPREDASPFAQMNDKLDATDVTADE